MTHKAQSTHPIGRIPTQITVMPNQQSQNTRDALSVTSKERMEMQFERNLVTGMSNVDHNSPQSNL